MPPQRAEPGQRFHGPHIDVEQAVVLVALVLVLPPSMPSQSSNGLRGPLAALGALSPAAARRDH